MQTRTFRLLFHTPQHLGKGRKVISLFGLRTDLKTLLKLGISTVGHIAKFVQKGKKKRKKITTSPQSANPSCEGEQLRESFPHLIQMGSHLHCFSDRHVWSQPGMNARSTQQTDIIPQKKTHHKWIGCCSTQRFLSEQHLLTAVYSLQPKFCFVVRSFYSTFELFH